MLLRRAGSPFSYPAVPPGTSGVRKRSRGAFPTQRKSHSAHLHTSQKRKGLSTSSKMASFIRRCTFEPGLQQSWDRSIGESRKVQDAGFLLRSFLPRGLQGPLGLRDARSLLRSFLSVIAGGSFLFGRSLAPQGYAVCYGAREGRQQNGARAGGARARADPAARAHTQRAERLVQPNRDEDTCLWADYIVQ